MRDAGNRQLTTDAADAGLALDRQFSIVPAQDVFHDGETEADAAIIPASAPLYTEEPFRQPRNVVPRRCHRRYR